MSFDLGLLWNYDSTTFLLLSIIVLLYTLRSYLQPIPLAHPILLGRQADIAKVRLPRETATYRNYGVGHGAPVSIARLSSTLNGLNLASLCFSSPRSPERILLLRMTCFRKT